MPEYRNRNNLPSDFEGKLADSFLSLIDCGQLMYVGPGEEYTTAEGINAVGPSPAGAFIRRDALKDPPEKPEGLPACPGEQQTETIVVNEDGSVSQTSSAPASDAAETASTTATDSTGSRFCGTEERVSTHTCNSLHPAICIDPSGNVGVAWHDTRDGTHEIYFRTLASKISAKEALAALEAAQNDLGRTVNVDCDPAEDLVAGDDLTYYSAGRRCKEGAATSGVLVRGENGILDVNVTARTMVLTTTDEGINFQEAGVQPDSLLRIETGLNANLAVSVKSVVGNQALDLAFVDGATPDSNFNFSILDNPTFSLTSCETRLTCSESTSLFPDVVCDSDGRFHVVYQSNNSGINQLYYIQVAPKDLGIKDDCGDNPPINVSDGFGEVPVGTPGSATYIDDTTDPDNPRQIAFKITGETGDFFSYGNRFLVPAQPNQSSSQASRTGTHLLFRDFVDGGGQWTGTSMAADRDAWDVQIATASPGVTPDVVFSSGHPLASEGDFGGRFTTNNVAFMAQTPPTAGVAVRRISLPIEPKCTPRGTSGIVELREQDLVQAPKRPLPPSYIDPVDVSQLLNSPAARLDQNVPPRFYVEGDPGGTVFTNILAENARGELSRLVFRKDDDQEEIKFVLGFQLCGDYPCGVKVPATVLEPESSVQFTITLEVWRGSDYRLGEDQVSSATMAATKFYQKDFKFGPGAEARTFTFEQGELILPEGSIIFFVPIASDNTEFTVEGTGGGNSVWLTNSDGLFQNYNTVPWTLLPLTGLLAPVYYDGQLINGVAATVTLDLDQTVILDGRTAVLGASVAFGQLGEDENLPTAYAVSQRFTIDEDLLVRSMMIRMARGTSSGVDDAGNSIPEDTSRELVIEIVDDDGGAPGQTVLGQLVVPALDLRGFDDSQSVPEDSDMGDLSIRFTEDVLLTAASYHVVLRENGDDDLGGRFWVLADAEGTVDVGQAAWNPARPIDPQRWKNLQGQLQMRMVFERPEG